MIPYFQTMLQLENENLSIDLAGLPANPWEMSCPTGEKCGDCVGRKQDMNTIILRQRGPDKLKSQDQMRKEEKKTRGNINGY